MLPSASMPEASLRERRQALLERRELRGPAFCRALSDQADEWLRHVAERASGASSRHLALVAVGGYGRRELCPYSDLDVVLLHDGRRNVDQVAEAIWYPVWDQGVHLDHSVRRPGEVLEAALGDLRVALGLLDARLVWGEARVVDQVVEPVQALWRGRAGAGWLDALGKQVAERHAARGEVAFLLEPDLKDGHGGLRDVHILAAVGKFSHLDDYVEIESLGAPASELTSARVELHRVAGRAQERLTLQDQDAVAHALDFGDADALMAAVASAGRTIAWASDEAWRRRRLWAPAGTERSLSPRLRRRKRSAPEPSPSEPTGDADVVVINDELALAPQAPVAEDPSLALRLAAAAARADLPIARSALHRLADRMPPPPEPWPPKLRQALVEVLATGPPAIAALEALDHEGLLVRLLPEWQAVRNRPQRNAYHRFTVDRHLLETAARAAPLASEVSRPDLLLLGALLHDIGKGFPGDHTEVGIEVAGRIARRLGLPPADIKVVEDLVRFHLLLPDTATRRDLDDPVTIETVARAAGDPDTLDLLAALTEADSLATGPAAWGTWKAGLVHELVARVHEHLRGRPAPSAPGVLSEVDRSLIEEVLESGRPVVAVEPPRVTVVAPDRPGLLSSVAGMLALHHLSVRRADAGAESGVAVEVFFVEADHGRWPDATGLTEALETILAHSEALEGRLAAKARDYASGRRPARAHPPSPRVDVHNEASSTSTVVDVATLDEVGLLHRLTRALFDCRLDVVGARVATIGSDVVDAFYVRDAHGAKVTEPERLAELTAAIEAVLTPPPEA